MLTVGSLFSGAGLCDLGLHWAGFQHRYFCEVDGFCQSILRRHWPDVPVFDDVRTISGVQLPHVDVLCGGFPCQDVSLAGRRAGITSTTRSGLWHEYKRIIDETRPRYIIAENVPGLLSLGIEGILQDLATLGYDAEWEVLGAGSCGAPHHRERVFIVAYPNGSRAACGARLLSSLKRNLGDYKYPGNLFAWAGIRFDRARKYAAAEAFCKPVIHRVDDGSTPGLDAADGHKPDARPHLLCRVDITTAKAWIPRLKALGNAITPQQAYAIGTCILQAEGLPVPPMP